MTINSKQLAPNRTDVAQRQALTAGLQECPDRCLARILWVYDAAMASPRNESDLKDLLGDPRFDFLVDPTGDQAWSFQSYPPFGNVLPEVQPR